MTQCFDVCLDAKQKSRATQLEGDAVGWLQVIAVGKSQEQGTAFLDISWWNT